MLDSTSTTSVIDFAPFRLDLRAGQLSRDLVPVPLRPKTFAVLQHLAQRAGELVTKQALLDDVWRDTMVSEDVVRLSVGELRVALGDQRTAPRFIETVPRRGYRFIAKMGAAGIGNVRGAESTIAALSAANDMVVGRSRERAEIARWFDAAMNGRCQIGFVTGEAGIGKTTLVETALRELYRTCGTRFRIARGQCVEHYGGGEPYLPVLDALASLRRADGPAVDRLLRGHAPDWLLDAMGLPAPDAVDRTARAVAAREHTLHRLALSLEALAAETLLVLILEDVQWMDYSTLDLLSIVAQRCASTRLLVLCTLRPADAIVRRHPVRSVKRELLRKGLCREILLDGLSAADIASYLATRFRAAHLTEDLLPLLVDRSEGNPFFMVALVDHLLEQRLLIEIGGRWELCGGVETLRTTLSDGLRAVIEPRLERLAADELRVLEAASVAGREFAAQAVARVMADGSGRGDIENVERLCDALVRRELLRAAGESTWPDGSVSARYGFGHALYQQVVYQRLSSSTRRRLHQTIGEALEAAYAGRTAEVASALAAHFEHSRDLDRAVRYREQAAERARSRFAYQETRLHLEAALALLRSQAETAERLRQELRLLHELGSTLFALRGYGDEGAARAFTRMRQLAERLDVVPMRLRAIDNLLLMHTMRAELPAARALAEEMIDLAEQTGNLVAAATSRLVLGVTLMSLGELEAAHQQAARSRYDPGPSPLPAVHVISSCTLLASTCAHLGLIARARVLKGDALARAAQLGIPYIRAHAMNFAAQVCALLRDVAEARALAEETVQLATEHGFSAVRIAATMVRGWCDVEDGHVDDGLAALRAAFADYATSGQRIGTTAFSVLLAKAHLASADAAGAEGVVDAALGFAATSGERLYVPELYRLKGECLLGSPRATSDATAYFKRALVIAAGQKAMLFELRAATSLCQVEGPPARERLARLVERFDVVDDCADLHAARALL